MGQVEGGKTPQGRSGSSFAIPQERNCSKECAKKRRGKHECWASWDRKKQKQGYPLHNSNKKGSPFGRLACKTVPQISEEGGKNDKKKNLQKGLPS